MWEGLWKDVLHIRPHDSLPVVVVTEWDTDISDTSFQNEAACLVFGEFTLFFFFEDAEGFAKEIWANFFIDDTEAKLNFRQY
jgi:hypothetical protein